MQETRNVDSEKQRAHWDIKYEQGLTSLTQPDPFFISAYETFVDRSFRTQASHWIWQAALEDMPYGWQADAGRLVS